MNLAGRSGAHDGRIADGLPDCCKKPGQVMADGGVNEDGADRMAFDGCHGNARGIPSGNGRIGIRTESLPNL